MQNTTQSQRHGSLPDDIVHSFKRGETSIILPPAEPLSGTLRSAPVCATLKDISDFQHPRSQFVSDLPTVMAFCRLPEGQTLDVDIIYNSSEGPQATSKKANIIQFWRLVDNKDVTNVTLGKPQAVVLNLESAKIYDVILETPEPGTTVVQSAITLYGNQRYAIKTTISPLFSGASPTYEIKQLRPEAPFAAAVNEGEYVPLNMQDSPGGKTYQNKERENYLKMM